MYWVKCGGGDGEVFNIGLGVVMEEGKFGRMLDLGRGMKKS